MELLLTVKGDSEQIHQEDLEKTCLLNWKPVSITHYWKSQLRGRLLGKVFLPLISSDVTRFSFCLMQTAGVDGKEVLLKTQEDGKTIIWCISLLPGIEQSWLLPPAGGDVGVCLPFWVFSTSLPNLKFSIETKEKKMLNQGILQCEWSSRLSLNKGFKLWKFFLH